MATNLTINGVTYSFPQTGDVSWGDNVTNWATAVTSGMLQKAGGLFTLTAETDFGASYGLKSLYYKSRTTNPASAGQVRLAVSDLINFRNNANNADLSVGIDASNNLTFQSTKLLLSGSVVNADINSAAAIAYSKLALSNSIVNADINSAAAIAYSKLALANSIVNSDISSSAAIAYSKLSLTGSILDADISASAAISRSKVATGSANHVVINDGTGLLSSEANLAISRGGTGAGTKAAAFNALSPNAAKGDITVYSGTSNVNLTVGSDGQVLTANSGATNGVNWASVVGFSSGMMIDFGGTIAPAGWLICDGSAVSRTTYSSLFSAIGTAWGSGDGSTTFNLPDTRRRTTVGSGGSGTGTLGSTVGSTGGEETHTLTSGELASHAHTITDPGHSHSLSGAYTTLAGSGTNLTYPSAGNGSSLGAWTNPPAVVSNTTGISATNNAGSGTAHNNIQPSAVVLKIIKT